MRSTGEHITKPGPSTQEAKNSVKIPQLKSHKGVNSWVQTYIWNQIYKITVQDQHYLELGRKKLALTKQEDEHRLKIHRQWTSFLNIYFVAVAIALTSVGLGLVIGINLPEGIVCHSPHTACYHLRLRPHKQVFK